MAEFYQQKPDFSLPITNDSNVTTRHQISAFGTAGCRIAASRRSIVPVVERKER